MKWDVQEAASSSYHVFGWIDGAVDGLKKHFGRGLNLFFYVGKKGRGYHYSHLSDMLEIGEYIVKKLRDTSFRKEIELKFIAYRDVLFEAISSVRDRDLSKLNVDGLESLYKKMNKAYGDFYSLTMYAEPVELFMDDYFKPLIKKLKTDFSVLTTPPKLSFIQEEKLDLIKFIEGVPEKSVKSIKSELKKNKLLLRAFQQHINDYAWLRTDYLHNDKLAEEDVLGRVNEIVEKGIDVEKQAILDFEKSVELRKDELIEKHKLSEEEKEMLAVSDFDGRMHDERKKYVLMWVYYCAVLLKEIGKRFGYSMKEMKFSSKYALENLFKKGKLDDVKVHEGYGAYVYVKIPGKYKEYYGKGALEYEKKTISEDFEESTFELQGMGVSLGKASGKVKVVHLKSDFEKFNKGDVLVAPMTRPEMVPLMSKAAAVVTDQGGITSHAAIVSRELGVPCVVGTKTATKVLKDGDLIDVNANHGKVRIIERK